MLLTSLLRQTYQNFDIVIGDNSAGAKVKQHQLCSFTLQRLQFEGHRVALFELPKEERDIGKLRNAVLKNDPFNNPVGVRIDDDSWVEPDYLELLVKPFSDSKIGVVGGVVPYLHIPFEGRPVPQKFNEVTSSFDWSDHCVFNFNTPRDQYFESGHVRSSYAYLTDLARQLKFPEYAGQTGFSEETEFCVRVWMSGYKVLFNPHARAWHYNLLYGGGRDLFAGKNEKEANETIEGIKTKNIAEMKRRLTKFREEKGLEPRSYP